MAGDADVRKRRDVRIRSAGRRPGFAACGAMSSRVGMPARCS